MNQQTDITAADFQEVAQGLNDEVIILSVERSGTNYFCECLGEFPEAARFFEFFARDGVYGLAANVRMHEPLSDVLGYHVKSDQAERLVSEIKDAPIKYLNMFSRVSKSVGAKFLSLKVFPGQVEFSKLRLALQGPKKRVIFITRSRLDCYISFQKAMASDVWQNLDTSDLRPEIRYPAFIRWATQQEEWYLRAEKTLRDAGTPYCIYSYEADINCPKEALVEKQYFTLRSFGLDVSRPIGLRGATFTKQDKATDPFAKIKNGDTFRAELEENDALAYALGKPLLD